MSVRRTEILQLFPVDSKPYGLTYEEWVKKWWCWLLRIPRQTNPACDNIGNNAYMAQENSPVFFLCQTFEQSGVMPTRRIFLNHGTALFFPLINWISIYPEDGVTNHDLSAKARSKMDSISDLTIILNGKEIRGLEKYRVSTQAFQIALPKDNILRLDEGKKKVISDGYWVFTSPVLEPLELCTFGSCTAGLTKIGVVYNIGLTRTIH